LLLGQLNFSRCDTKHLLPCTIATPFYLCYNGTSRLESHKIQKNSVVTGIEPTTSGLLSQHRSRSDEIGSQLISALLLLPNQKESMWEPCNCFWMQFCFNIAFCIYSLCPAGQAAGRALVPWASLDVFGVWGYTLELFYSSTELNRIRFSLERQIICISLSYVFLPYFSYQNPALFEFVHRPKYSRDYQEPIASLIQLATQSTIKRFSIDWDAENCK